MFFTISVCSRKQSQLPDVIVMKHIHMLALMSAQTYRSIHRWLYVHIPTHLTHSKLHTHTHKLLYVEIQRNTDTAPAFCSWSLWSVGVTLAPQPEPSSTADVNEVPDQWLPRALPLFTTRPIWSALGNCCTVIRKEIVPVKILHLLFFDWVHL